MPSLSNKSREAGELQDMYRRNLTAYWTAQPGELRADECIENIFAGGDGWGIEHHNHHDASSSAKHGADHNRLAAGDADVKGWHRHKHNWSRDASTSKSKKRYGSLDEGRPSGSTGGRASLEHHANNLKAEAATHQNQSPLEVDEFELREDLRSWRIVEA